jgi:ankyrin repeat protein
MTALHIAAYYGEEDITRELFKHIPAHSKTSQPTKPENALVEALCYESDLSPIHLAAYTGSENVVRAVLNQPGVEVADKSTPSGYTALHLACLTGHVGVVGLLLSRSTDLLKVIDAVGQTAIHVAASNGHHEMCQASLCLPGCLLLPPHTTSLQLNPTLRLRCPWLGLRASVRPWSN